MMKSTTSMIALLLALGLAAPVVAQETGDDTAEDVVDDATDGGEVPEAVEGDAEGDVDVDVDVDAEGDTADDGTGDTADDGADAEGGDTEEGDDTDDDDAGDADEEIAFGDIISDLRNNSVSVEALDELRNLPPDVDVVVIRLTNLRGQAGENAAALDQALESRKDTLVELQTAVSESATLRTALDAEGLLAERVVSVQTLADGRVILVVDDSV